MIEKRAQFVELVAVEWQQRSARRARFDTMKSQPRLAHRSLLECYASELSGAPYIVVSDREAGVLQNRFKLPKSSKWTWRIAIAVLSSAEAA